MKVELELTTEQLNETKTKYNLTGKISKGRLKPKLYDVYWNISGSGEIWKHEWANTCYDNYCYATGNYYCSEAEAGFAKQKRLVTQELKDFALEHNEGKIDWENNNSAKYCLYSELTNALCELYVGIAWQGKYGSTIYFTSHEIAQQAVNKIGEERLIKYYFGDWEDI